MMFSANPPIERNSARLPGLDLLRAFAVVWVMLYHVTSYGPSLPEIIEFGYMAVDLFFVLSGFLIGEQLLSPYAAGSEPHWWQFYLRRAFRILPAYLVMVMLYFAVPAIRESEGIQPLWQFLTFTQNMFADYFRARAFSHAWSLCIEEHFYLILPPIVWLLARKPSATRLAMVAIVLLLGGMVLRAWLWQHSVAPLLHIASGEGDFFTRYIEKIYNPTFTRLDGLLAGVLLAVVKVFRPGWWTWAMVRSRCFLAGGLIGVAATMCMPSPGYASAVSSFPLLSASFACIVLASSSPKHWAGLVPGVFPIASMAFSLYLAHKPVYQLIHSHFDAQLQDANLLALCVYGGGALAAGSLLYLTVERPGVRLCAFILNRRRRRPGGDADGSFVADARVP